MNRLRFGDIIENGWASEENPTRRGYFVRQGNRTGRMNAGRYIVVTDGNGKFWELPTSGAHKITVMPGFLTNEVAPATHAAKVEGEGSREEQPSSGRALLKEKGNG